MILVTGGSGLIGRHLSYTGTYLGRRPQEGRVCRECDLSTETPDLTGVTTVVHLAQSRRYKDGPDGYEDVWRVNTDSTFRLLEAARKAGVQHFVYASTGSVINGTDVYAASKATGERIVEAFSQHFNTLILRLYAVYGEGQREDALVSTLIRRVMSGQDIRNGIRTAPCYAADAAAAIELAVSRGDTGVRAISGPDVMTAYEMAKIIGKLVGKNPVLTDCMPVMTYRRSDYSTLTTFADGLRRMQEAGCDIFSSAKTTTRRRGRRSRARLSKSAKP